jgi:hypothetical protein
MRGEARTVPPSGRGRNVQRRPGRARRACRRPAARSPSPAGGRGTGAGWARRPRAPPPRARWARRRAPTWPWPSARRWTPRAEARRGAVSLWGGGARAPAAFGRVRGLEGGCGVRSGTREKEGKGCEGKTGESKGARGGETTAERRRRRARRLALWELADYAREEEEMKCTKQEKSVAQRRGRLETGPTGRATRLAAAAAGARRQSGRRRARPRRRACPRRRRGGRP